MKYCKICVLPDTRPNLYILSDGICLACHSKKKLRNSNNEWIKRFGIRN